MLGRPAQSSGPFTLYFCQGPDHWSGWEWVYQVTAAVPRDTMCLASSQGSSRHTASHGVVLGQLDGPSSHLLLTGVYGARGPSSAVRVSPPLYLVDPSCSMGFFVPTQWFGGEEGEDGQEKQHGDSRQAALGRILAERERKKKRGWQLERADKGSDR